MCDGHLLLLGWLNPKVRDEQRLTLISEIKHKT